MPLAAFYWNPSPNIFVLPWIDLPLRWYSLFFTLGFFFAYYLVKQQVSEKAKSIHSVEKDTEEQLNTFLDQLLWYIVIGTLLGARLAHVFFYDWDYFKSHPVEIFMVWHGGLASHGGVIGVVLATALCFWINRKKILFLSFFHLADAIALAAPLSASCIRIGNFFNQEILGIPTDVPWAIIFGSPMNGSAPTPRHPVQLYEAIGYFAIFLLLLSLPKWRSKQMAPGTTLALLLVTLFSFRCLMEYYKTSYSIIFSALPWLKIGQLLSIPFIVAGLLLFWYAQRKANKAS